MINVKVYEKPVVSVDAGMAEGVYAASGATNSGSVNVGFLRYAGDWGTGGTVVYSVDLSGLNPSQLTVVLNFNNAISGAWSDGASSNVSGKSATLNWYSAPSTAEISVQVQGSDIKQLQCTGSSYHNA